MTPLGSSPEGVADSLLGGRVGNQVRTHELTLLQREALLQRAFGIGWERGRRSCVLATDTRTGALGLYEHVGMTPRGTYMHLRRSLP